MKSRLSHWGLVVALGASLFTFAGFSGNGVSVLASSPPMYAYTSAHSGHWSHKINPAGPHSVVASLGDFSSNTNWRCSWNTNMVNNAGTKVYQGRSCDAVVTEIDVATDTYRTLATGGRSNAMALSPDDRYLYTAEAYYINKWDLSVTPPQNVAGGSRNDNNAGINLGILPDGSKLYSPTIQGGKNQVQVFGPNLALLATITDPLIVSPQWALPNPNGTEVWIGAGNSFIIVDAVTNAVTRTYTFAHGTTSLPSFNSDGSRLYLSAGDLLEFSTVNGTVTRTFSGLGSGSHASVSPDGRFVYVAYGQVQKWVELSSGTTGTITLPTQSPNNDTPRTIVWAQPVSAPNISLSSVSGTATTGAPVGNLYTVTNTGGAVATYSISPQLPAGLTLSPTLGTISGTPTALQTATTHTLTATNRGGTSTATFTLNVVAPATTTTVTTTTTVAAATTVPQAVTTTIPPAAEVGPTAGTTPVSLATVTTIPTTSRATPSSIQSATATVGSILTTTTAAVSTSTVPPPQVGAADPGAAAATVDGESVPVDLSRSGNALVVTVGEVEVSVHGVSSDGQRVELDADGSLAVTAQDKIVVEASGFAAAAEVAVWLFSDPSRLGVLKSSTGGLVSGSFALPPSTPTGDHRVVVSGRTRAGSDSVIGVGLRIGAYEKESGLNMWVIILPLVLATILALVIPTTARRRKRANG